jgi:signal transduction histidine kinase
MSILNGILDWSKIEADSMTLEHQTMQPHALIGTCIRLHKQGATNNGVWLDWQVNGDLPAHLFCDPVKLSQILNNLLSNGIKFTQQGKVALDVSYQQGNLSHSGP